jgi:hypothetical protein
MKQKIIQLSIALILVVSALSISALAQGRGRGGGLGRKSEVFVNGRDARNRSSINRGRNQSWKCGVFVNCHDARDGRWDGRGPRMSRTSRTNPISSRGARVGYRNRYNMGDYWRHRHVTYVNNGGRYRNRSVRNR